ncbi:haloacid dehalogenase-like hydrolase [Lysobacter enzymogenes]|uniref:Haloacid dehalogenase-like hydrolase n=1 Tax=Lysobacter enzymogenes TaxID=69 RepID=A0A0S2DC13_LYSEN|nr:HAD family hydrolase [Lysobacter enzymogenes]ALN55896.1 haloacid dehalogenase-like hydrolase [Lysobacter enzymogenes]QCW24861.1 HAD family hydrolase [Lysobacter enzymogenes]
MTLRIHNNDKVLRAPQAIIFDTDNTLYAYDRPHSQALAAAERKAAKLLGVGADEVSGAFARAREDVKRQLGKTASSHSRLLYFQRGIEILGRKTQLVITLDLEQTYWRTFLSHCELFPGVREFLQALRSSGIGTAIITDLTSQIQFRKIIYFGLDDCFDYVVTSEEAGADKPQEAPFRLAIDKLGIDPARIWMIGDHPVNDIAGARPFGISTLLRVDRNHEGRDAGCDVEFDDFTELHQFFFSGKVDGVSQFAGAHAR